MRTFRLGIYWKLFLTILAGIFLSSLVVLTLYLHYPAADRPQRSVPPGAAFIIGIGILSAIMLYALAWMTQPEPGKRLTADG